MPKGSKHDCANYVGRKYGKLTVVRYSHSLNSRRFWVCDCECGGTATVPSTHLNTGNSKSCGCLCRELAKARSKTHGCRHTPEYRIWSGIIERCCNPNNPAYKNYGGRGIAICERWRNSFSDFLADVGRRPSPDLTLDRIDNNGNYEPGNCRWATRKEQHRNMRMNVLLTYEGETMCVSAWAEKLGINVGTIRSRLTRDGMSVQEALSRPVKRNLIAHARKEKR